MEIRTYRRIAYTLCLGTPLLTGADRIIEDHVTTTLVFRKVAIPPESFKRDGAIERARQFLSQHPDVKMARLTFAPDEEPANYNLTGCIHCDLYSFWRGPWDSITRVNFPIAELMSIEGNAVLRYRDDHGVTSATILKGVDPRMVYLGDFKGMIIHVGMQGRIEDPMPQLYIVGTGALPASNADDYAGMLTSRLAVRQSWIEFRSDPWFIGEIVAPFLPLFDITGPVPSRETFNATPWRFCFSFTPTNHGCSWEGIENIQ